MSLVGYALGRARRAGFAALLAAAVFPIFSTTSVRADDAGYAEAVRAQIAKNVTYPRMAKMREQEGTVGYSVKINASGAVTDASVDAPSGVSSLDSATIDAIKASAPFAAPPSGETTVHGNVAYKLS